MCVDAGLQDVAYACVKVTHAEIDPMRMMYFVLLLMMTTFQVTAQTDHVYMLSWSSDGELLETIYVGGSLRAVAWSADGSQVAYGGNTQTNTVFMLYR